jgi:hypothetical protein
MAWKNRRTSPNAPGFLVSKHCSVTELAGKTPLLWWGLAILPALFLIFMLCRYSLDVPYLDQWEFAVLLGKALEGHTAFQDFWGLHNEHRPLFPRLLLLLLARLSHWNILWELWANLLCGVAIFAVSVYAWQRVAAAKASHAQYPVVLPLSLLVFSMSQWQNWFFGWQVQEFMQILAVMLGLIFLDGDGLNARRVAGAVAMGIIATFSFASGLVFWPVGLLAILLKSQTSRVRRVRWVLSWTLVSLLVLSAYLYRFRTVDYHPAPWRPAELTASYTHYVLSFLGAPLATYSPVGSMLAGLLGLVLFAGLTVHLIRSRAAAMRDVALPICLAAFSLGAALMTGFGRIAFGVEQAMSSRYVTLANPLWIAIVILMGLEGSLVVNQGRKTLRRLSISMLALLAFLIVCNAAYGTLKWTERYHYLAPARTALISGDDPAILQRLHPDPRIVIVRREILRRHKLSVFRE